MISTSINFVLQSDGLPVVSPVVWSESQSSIIHTLDLLEWIVVTSIITSIMEPTFIRVVGTGNWTDQPSAGRKISFLEHRKSRGSCWFHLWSLITLQSWTDGEDSESKCEDNLKFEGWNSRIPKICRKIWKNSQFSFSQNWNLNFFR